MQNDGECWILENISLHSHFITDIHFAPHTVFIAYTMHLLDSEGILFLRLSILTIPTLSIGLHPLYFPHFLVVFLCFHEGWICIFYVRFLPLTFLLIYLLSVLDY
jgi:hypothetical protein